MLSEYCSRAEVTRARARFFQRRARLLLYTERAHFYNRFSLRGIRVRVPASRVAQLPPAPPARMPTRQGAALARPRAARQASCEPPLVALSGLALRPVDVSQDVLFYGPPDHGHYYPELANLLQPRGGGSGASAGGATAALAHGTVTMLFCAFDALALGRIVGAGRCSKMLDPDAASSFVFC